MSLLVFYLWMLTRHPSTSIYVDVYGAVSQDDWIWEIFRTCPYVCGILHCGILVWTSDWLLHGQRSVVSSQFLFAEGMDTPPELCPCGCAALLFHLGRSYGSLSHGHSVMHTAQETLKNHRCLPQNLPHLASWQHVWGGQCPQQTVLPFPAHGQSQILLFFSSLTLSSWIFPFSNLQWVRVTRKAINNPGLVVLVMLPLLCFVQGQAQSADGSDGSLRNRWWEGHRK